MEVVEAANIMEAAKVVEAAEVVEMGEVAEAREKEEDMALATPVWTQVHPSRAPVPVGLVHYSLGDEQQCHHSHSCHSQQQAHLQSEQDWQSSDPSCSTSGSSTTTHYCSPLAASSCRAETSMEGSIARLQAPLPGYAYIADVL